MDAYPEDMLVGFFPLVFAVDAMTTTESSTEDNSSPSKQRSLFERFLDALAASLIDESETENAVPDRKRSIALFRSEEDDDSQFDDTLLDFESGGTKRRLTGFYAGLRNNSVDTSMDDSHATSYAKDLNAGQGYFQRARIVSVSPRYGFPPSKDPVGNQNLATSLSQARKKRQLGEREQTIKRIFQEYKGSLNGIIPSGWLEKHVHALPSVILVVCSVTSSRSDQETQDRHLYETIEHLQYSLVAKRKCPIQIVGLLKDDVTQQQGDAWSATIMSNVVNEENQTSPSESPHVSVMLLRASEDLKCNDIDLPCSLPLKRLHRATRDASLLYYLRQARRTRDKLAKLAGEKKRGTPREGPPVELSPLIVRYCFKISIFYEFQMKHEKSLWFMSEAYRFISKYYQWLLSRSEKNNPIADDSEKPIATSQAMTDDSEEGVEVELNENSEGSSLSRFIPAPPDDMIHQCRAVADWLNLKLLSAGLSSHNEGGLVAAAHQWRLHSRVFCTRRYSSKLKLDSWYEWSYITRQRLVMCQLLERHPPKSISAASRESTDEVLLRCSTWRTYVSAAEAMLRLGNEIEKAKANTEYHAELQLEKKDPMRPRYLGGVGNNGLSIEYMDECKVDHKGKALESILRAIALFEDELQREKRGFYAEDSFGEQASSRTGARLYYLAGGILLGMERHQESAGHLIKAARHARGWTELELATRRLLIECYEKHIPEHSESSESSQTLVSMILDSYFNAEMSSKDLRRALEHFASMTGGESLKWYHAATGEDTSGLPFSFAVSFPGKTTATTGDTVQASVMIRSNLDYAVHINSVSLKSLAGTLPIPSMDLLSAQNANEGSDGGIIMQAKTAIFISTKLDLPKDLARIESDDSGNGGEKQGVAGKGSFAKSARPRSAGITAAGGARLVSEEKLLPGNRNSQGWNLRFIGGKPLICDGLHTVFYPVQAEISSGGAEKVTLIELTIEKKSSRTAANIKRTPFEEENYIASAWSRPLDLPLSRGPRSLRVLGPQPQLIIRNITDEITKGKALEGTVNRILFKLQAGPHERCSNMKVRVSCFSVLITPGGTTNRLVSEEELTKEVENSHDMKNPSFRTPAMVLPSKSTGKDCVDSGYGYDLPSGWELAGSGQGDNQMEVVPLKEGESSFVNLDFFRPATHSLKQFDGLEDRTETEILTDTSVCKTDFYVTITYTQERPSTVKQRRVRRAIRRRPVRVPAKGSAEDTVDNADSDETLETEQKRTSDEVSLEFSGSLVWASPLSAVFSPGTKIGFPSGSQHPSNTIGPTKDADDDFVLHDGESVTMKCTLQLSPAIEGLKTEIVSVRLEDNKNTALPITLSLQSNETELIKENTIYKSAPDDPSRILSSGSKFGVSYTARAKLKSTESGAIRSTLGGILVDWIPSILELPEGHANSDCSLLGAINAHGPLALSTHSTVRFQGPSCYIEGVPFQAERLGLGLEPSVGNPFDVNYRIKNTTGQHQLVHIIMGEFSTESGLLITGLTNGDLWIGPSEEQIVSFTALATRPGEMSFPSLRVSSGRYQTWVIDSVRNSNPIFVFP